MPLSPYTQSKAWARVFPNRKEAIAYWRESSISVANLIKVSGGFIISTFEGYVAASLYV